MCKGNDVQNYNNVAFLSGPYVSAGALSVVPDNFAKAMVVHAVRKSVRKSWINDRDQFLQPNEEPSASFVRRCAISSLFADSNQTSSLRNVAYRGRTFQVINHFFPFKASLLEKWDVSDSDIRKSLERDSNDRFVAIWLAEQKQDALGEKMLEVARDIYGTFFRNFKDLPTAKYRIEHWDAGWWQIKRCLVEVGLEKERLARVEEIKDRLSSEIREAALHLGMIATVDMF
jgi:hypothetical protein